MPRIVTATWATITSLALAIFQRGEIGQSDINAALGLPDAERDPERRAHAISAIRSGQVPGTFAVSGTYRPHWMD